MPADFRGYLFQSDGEPFPHNLIVYGSYTTLPNSREEIKAYRDDNTRNLTRITSQGHKSSFSFKTRKNLHLEDIVRMREWFTTHIHNELERKLNIEYWNNEELEYKTADFYCADIKYPILQITENDIIYDEFEIDFVEY